MRATTVTGASQGDREKCLLRRRRSEPHKRLRRSAAGLYIYIGVIHTHIYVICIHIFLYIYICMYIFIPQPTSVAAAPPNLCTCLHGGCAHGCLPFYGCATGVV